MDEKVKALFLVGDKRFVDKKIIMVSVGEEKALISMTDIYDRENPLILDEHEEVKREELNIKVKKSDWRTVKQIKKKSTIMTIFSGEYVSPDDVVENHVRYLISEIEGLDLEFDLDDKGIEYISDDSWAKIDSGEFAIRPEIITTMYDAIKEVNGNIV